MAIVSTTYRIDGPELNQMLIVNIRGHLADVDGIGYVGFDIFADGAQHMVVKHKDSEPPLISNVQAAVSKTGPYTLTQLSES